VKSHGRGQCSLSPAASNHYVRACAAEGLSETTPDAFHLGLKSGAPLSRTRGAYSLKQRNRTPLRHKVRMSVSTIKMDGTCGVFASSDLGSTMSIGALPTR
jgi:hypothetical protein